MKLPTNQFMALSALWFVAGIYALLFRESGQTPPPFPHFDKVAHFSLFFAQIWLLAKAFMQAKQDIPYRGLMIFALIYAISSECAQAMFTLTREGTVADGIADILGCLSALWFAHQTKVAKQQLQANKG